MKYVMTVVVKKLGIYKGDQDKVTAPKNDMEKAYIFEDFEIAKKKFRETITGLIKSCKFFPYADSTYKPLKELCDDCEYTDDDITMIIFKKLSKFLSDPEYFGSFPNDIWGYEDHTFITKDNEFYYNIDGDILHSNAIEMSDPSKTYYFEYRFIDDYEPRHSISIFMKPIDIA